MRSGTLIDTAEWRSLLLLFAGMLVGAALELAWIGGVPAFVALLTQGDRALAKVPDALVPDLLRTADPAGLALAAAAVLAAIVLIKNAYMAALIYAEARVLRDLALSWSNRLFSGYLHSPYALHLERNPAQLIRNISSEVHRGIEVLRRTLWTLREGLTLLVVLALLVAVDPVISLLLLLPLGMAAATFHHLVRGRLARRGLVAQAHRGRLLQIINQSLGSIKDVKILGRERHLAHAFEEEAAGSERHELFQVVVSALPRLFFEVTAIAAVLIVAAVFVIAQRPAESMLPVLALIAVGAARTIPALNAISASLARIRYERPALELVRNELRTLDAHPAEPAREQGELARMRAGIVARGLSYSYGDSREVALHDVSIEIRAGEAVALIGPSGAGKSTLIDILLGLLAPATGGVYVDGRDIRLDIAAWQKQIGYVPQEIYVLDDTVRRNIAFGLPDDRIDDQAVARAAAAAGLDALVASLPAGLETVVGHRGIRLSGGQRQRIGIARALYHDPGVLVLDEATAALDDEAEREILNAVGRLQADRTLIMIAHRLTTVRNCDRIYMLDAGRVVDCGTYRELAARHPHLPPPHVQALEFGIA